jgi:hypothetical protein
MYLPSSRTPRLRTVAAATLAAASFALVLPGIANAAPAKPGDRTVLVKVQNETSERFKLVGWESDVSEGKWTTEPPKAIKSYSTGKFGSTSSEAKGGTEATVVYKTAEWGNIEIYYDNPWASKGDASCEVPDELTCDITESGSSTTKLTFTISED